MYLKKVELDEVELFLELFKSDNDVSNLTYKEIAEEIQNRYAIQCSEQDIFLLHEPTLQDEIYDSEYFYKQVLGI